MSKSLIDVKEAAKIIGTDYTTLQAWLKEKDKEGHPTCPFGYAIPCKKTYRYIILRTRFEKYISGGDMVTVTARTVNE